MNLKSHNMALVNWLVKWIICYLERHFSSRILCRYIVELSFLDGRLVVKSNNKHGDWAKCTYAVPIYGDNLAELCKAEIIHILMNVHETRSVRLQAVCYRVLRYNSDWRSVAWICWLFCEFWDFEIGLSAVSFTYGASVNCCYVREKCSTWGHCHAVADYLLLRTVVQSTMLILSYTIIGYENCVT